VIVALVLYALLPILRNTFVESSMSIGRCVNLRLRWHDGRTVVTAGPVASGGADDSGGIRVATVTTIGTATIAAAIGGGGLAYLFFEEWRRWTRHRFWRGPCRRPASHCWRMGDWDGSNENYRRADFFSG